MTATITDSGGNSSSATVSSFTYNTTPPVGTITYPVNNAAYGTNWTGSLTGTSSATSPFSVSSVKLTITDTTPNPDQYWNGTSWTTTLSTVTPTGTTSWSYPLASSHLTSGHVYTVIETVTDSGGNTSTTTNTFTYQATAPTVSITTPSASGYGANYPTAWSGTATPASPLSLSSTTVSILNSTTGKYWTGSGFTSRRRSTWPPAARRGPGPTPDRRRAAWSRVTATR